MTDDPFEDDPAFAMPPGDPDLLKRQSDVLAFSGAALQVGAAVLDGRRPEAAQLAHRSLSEALAAVHALQGTGEQAAGPEAAAAIDRLLAQAQEHLQAGLDALQAHRP